MPHVERDRGLGIDGIQMEMVEAGSRELAAISKLHCQIPTLDVRKRYSMRPATFLEHHDAILNRSDPPGKRGLPIQRLTRHEFCQAPPKPPVIRFMPQRSIEARRRNLQGVGMVDQIVDLDAFAHLSTDTGTVVEGHSSLVVDKERQHPMAPTTTPLQIYEVHSLCGQ